MGTHDPSQMSHHLITDEATVEINQGKEMCIQNSTVDLAAKIRGPEDCTCREASEEVFQWETEMRLDLSRITRGKQPSRTEGQHGDIRVNKGGVYLRNIKGHKLARKQDAD